MKTKNNLKVNLLVVVTIALSILFFSCKKQESLITNPDLQSNLSSSLNMTTIPFNDGGNMILGISKQNPYTVENMAVAWQNLINKGFETTTETSVHTTHYYVKFKPQNEAQYDILHADTTLSFSDFPIESVVIQNGDYYHDQSLPDSVPTYQYTAVKTDYQFPENIPYEIISNNKPLSIILNREHR